jgi:hypothetical protein
LLGTGKNSRELIFELDNGMGGVGLCLHQQRKEPPMGYTITEVVDKKTTRTYNLNGPKFETIDSFWSGLVAGGVIESYKIEEAK